MTGLIQACLDLGISSFDHADIYGHYSTEADFGKALSASRIDRNRVQLISKCGIQLISEQRSAVVKHYNYAYSYLVWSVEQSLKNLKTDYLDLLLLHRPCPLMQAEEIAKAIEHLKQAGKILNFGVSNFTPAQTDLLNAYIQVSYNQIEFSMTHFEPMLNGSLDHMQQKKIKPMCWSPFGSVFKSETEQVHRIKTLASRLAEKYSVSFEAILLAWILKHPAGIIPVFGTTDTARISRLQESIRIELDLQDWFLLWTASIGQEVP